MKKILLILAIVVATSVIGWWAIQIWKNQETPTPLSPISSIVPPTQMSPGTQTYRNEQYGFEFQYPEEWTFHANTFGSPFSKFNLVGAWSKDENNGLPDPTDPLVLINVVTPDFAKRAFSGLTGSEIIIGGIKGERYEYQYEGSVGIGINVSIGEYNVLVGAKKKYEATFNQILATFKFIK